ncbi:serine/arginine repetitive matrix protein 1-like [Oryza brachyantha]|uniref:serine/arginine repetitive matrix protein 1-like n=1 Tax=Oryza brachyantha TaxID=4533 RepID=UPI001ADA9B68|nr:serine/arginine repetitive matrix protein 1-like [Oryza brachyantha]
MGCCFSKKRRKHLAGAAVFSRHCKLEDSDPPPPPLPEEEKVKEVLSETPSAKVRPEAKPVANVAVLEEPEVEKLVPKPRADAEATVSDLGSCMSLATDDRSEAASESSVATSSVAGPERSPGKPARKRPVSVSGELGHARSRRDRAVAAYGVRSRSARASPSPPPRREQRDRSVRRSPSPAAKRTPEHRRAASPAASLQRKPPVPVRPSPRRVQEAPPPPVAPLPAPPLPQAEDDDAVTADGEPSIADAASAGGDGQGNGDGEGKESLDNPLVSLECFIFL